MKVRVLTARGGHPCGAVVDVDDAVGQTWIGVGDAEAVQTSALEAAAVVEAAVEPLGRVHYGAAIVVEPPLETAMKRKARGRG